MSVSHAPLGKMVEKKGCLILGYYLICTEPKSESNGRSLQPVFNMLHKDDKPEHLDLFSLGHIPQLPRELAVLCQ
jgi:hypothetical protein